MILTYKVKHDKDFTGELKKAKQIAEFAVQNKFKTSSKLVAHIGLKSVISNQILRKYGKNKTIKAVHNVNLIVPNQGIKFSDGIITIPCLKLELPFDKQVNKINQVELNNTYAFISCEVEEQPQIVPKVSLGVDLNTTGHCVVASCPETGKVWKLGKQATHIHQKYKNIRKELQSKGKYKKVKVIKNRESRIVRDLNHKISRFIVNLATKLKGGIKLEDLKGIRNSKKHGKKFRYALNSWSFYQLRQFIEYKAKLAGIPVTLIEPAYTSQTCSKCGQLGERTGKQFKCPTCGHVENADVNASFNIALLSAEKRSISQLHKDRDLCKGNSDIPKEATGIRVLTLEPMVL
jgi:putative transposase